MASREHGVTLRRTFRAAREPVWALVADTDRWDRAFGFAPGRYTWREHEGQRLRAAEARELGFQIEWTESPYEWIEGTIVVGQRIFHKGPVARGGFRASVRELESGVEVVANAYVAGEGALASIAGAIMKQ